VPDVLNRKSVAGSARVGSDAKFPSARLGCDRAEGDVASKKPVRRER
jgi:hypothetical protein